MASTSTPVGYGRVAVFFHWISALFILAMLPMGFLMQGAEGSAKLVLYRAHAGLGFMVLLLTLARLVWKIFDPKPLAAPGLSGFHLRAMEAIHVLLYIAIFALVGSGLVMGIQSGLFDVLRGGSTESFPDFKGLSSRVAHGNIARIYMVLLVVHIGGVILHQYRHGHVLARMGIGRIQTQDDRFE